MEEMTAGELAQILTALAAVFGGIAAIISAIVSLKTSWKVDANTTTINEVKHATNSLTDRLVKRTAIASEALGKEKERVRQEDLKK